MPATDTPNSTGSAQLARDDFAADPGAANRSAPFRPGAARDSLSNNDKPLTDRLSSREREAMELTVRAMSNVGHLNTSEATVKRHLCKVFGKPAQSPASTR
ncbi:hypothetical protein AB0F15_21345 [Amycolatopsis sp. NPDC026612]|uniref:hypothetical protein n=1 Tax=Amycolatopsis sp. NPDC026612 TaxID=3155466 RepID=UPI0033F528F0